MRKLLILPIITFLIIYLAGSQLPKLGSLAKLTVSEDPKIGVLVPLTGPLAEFGIAVKNGFELAQLEHPERFAKLGFVFEDSRYDAKTSITALSKLAWRRDISLVYNWGTATGEALAPVAEAREIALITNSQTPSLSENREYVLRFVNPAEDFSKALLKSLRQRGMKRIAVVKAELGYINELLEGVQRNLAMDETLEVVDTYSPEEQDFKSTITKLKAKDYDAVGVFLITGQISQFYRQAAAQNLSVPTFGSDFFESRAEIADAGPSIEGAFYSNVVVSDAFKTKYFERFGSDTHLTYASNAYDFALLSADLFANFAPGESAAATLRRYQEVQSRDGTSGEFAYKETLQGDKYFTFPIGVKQITAGQIVLVDSQ